MKRFTDIRRRVVATVVCLIAAFVVAGGSAAVFMTTAKGKAFLVRRLNERLRTSAGMGMRIGELGGEWRRRITVETLSFYDADGTWLRIRSASVRWRPGRLLRGHLHVTGLRLSGVRLTRLPEGGGPDTEETTRRFYLPLRVTVDDFHLENGVVEGLPPGGPVGFEASGKAAFAGDGRLQADLTARRDDGRGGRARMEARFQPSPDRLDLAFSASEPGGGILARVLGIENLPPLSVDLHGTGPLDAWRGAIEIRSGEKASLKAGVTLDAGRRKTIGVEGTTDFGRLLAERLRPLVPGPVTFAVEAAFLDDGLELRTLTAAGDSGSLSASGKWQQGKADIELSLEPTPEGIRAMNRWTEPVSIGGLRLGARLAGPLDRPELSLDVSAKRATIENLIAERLEGSVEVAFPPAGEPLPVRSRGRLTGIRSKAPVLAALLADRLRWQADGTYAGDSGRVTIRQAEISPENGGAGLRGSGRLETADGSCDLHATATLDDLGALSEVARRPLAGRLDVSGRIRSPDLKSGFEAALEGVLSGFSVEGLAVESPLGPRVTVSAVVTSRAAAGWAVRDLEAKCALAALSGSATLSEENRIEGRYLLEIPELAGLSPFLGKPLSGRLAAEGRLEGPLESPHWRAAFSSPGLYVAGFDAGRLEAGIEATVSGQGAEGRAELRLEGGGSGDHRAESDFAVPGDGVIHWRDLQVETHGARLRGALRTPLDGSPLTGGLSGRIPSLEGLSPYAGFPVSGSGRFDLAFFDREGLQGADLRLDGENLAVTPGDGRDAAVARLAAKIGGVGIFTHPTGDIDLDLSGVRLMGAEISALSLDGDVDGFERLAADVRLSGRLPVPFSAAAAGHYSRRAPGTEWVLSRLDATIDDRPLTLEQPAFLKHTAASGTAARLAVAFGEARVAAAGTVTGETVNGSLDVSRLPLELASMVFPEFAPRGYLSAAIRLSGPRGAPEGRLTVNAESLTPVPDSPGNLPPAGVAMAGEWRNRRLALSGEITGISTQPAAIRLELPVRLDAESLLPGVPRGEPIGGAISWRGDVGPLWKRFVPGDHRLEGNADLALQLGGTVAAPETVGHLEVLDGRYANLRSGTRLEGLTLRITGNRERLSLERFAGGDGNRGRMEGKGFFLLKPEAHFPFELRLDFQEMALVDRDDLSASAGGRLDLSGSLAEIRLGGDITTGRVDWFLGSALPPEVVELEVTEVHGGADMPAGGEAPDAPPLDAGAVHLDFRIRAPGAVFVKGMGLDSQWKGDLKITGPAEDTRIMGTLEPVGGSFTFVGKTFTLREGTVSFPGGPEADPLLNLTADYRTRDLTAIVTVTGSGSRPKIAITSKPPLPQPEIVSRVLFGTEPANLTPAQSLQLASTLAASGNVGGIGKVVQKLRRSLGVDVLSFQAGGTDGTASSVSVGKYLKNGLYIELEQETGEDAATSATVEVQVGPNITVEGGASDQGSGKMGIQWKWDY